MSDGSEPEPGSVREARLLFHAGVWALPLMAIGFVVGLELTIPDGVYVAFLLGTLPLFSMAQIPLLGEGQVERLSAYAGSVVMLVVLTVVALLLGFLGPGLEALGLQPSFGAEEARTVGLLVAVVVVLGVAFHFAGEWLGIDESPILKALIPRTPRERRLFVVLSFSAGFGEEIVYRGYLLALLAPIFSGPWMAAVASSLAFALLHAYQGPVGILRSGMLGFVFAAAFVLTGSIWPQVVVHAGVDLISGLWLGPRMLAKDH